MATFRGIDLENLKQAIDGGTKAIQEGAKNIDIDGAVHKISDAASAGADMAGALVDGFKEGYSKTDMMPDVGITSATDTFIRLMAYLALSDGDITQEERAKFSEIGHELDAGFDEYGDTVMAECLDQVESDEKEFGRQVAVKIGAQKVIDTSSLNDREKKTLCWDMLTIAGADGLVDSEVDLIKFVAKKLEIDPVVLQEMRNYYGAAADLEREKGLIAQSNRPYNEIEPIANEISDRQLAVADAIHELIEDN